MTVPDTPRPYIRVPRRRVGIIKYINDAGTFGFIDAEDFRDDVFFHHTVWDASCGLPKPLVDQTVEYELEEEPKKHDNKLKARIVRPTKRPTGGQLEPTADPHLRAKHHPKARRKRPTWRNKES